MIPKQSVGIQCSLVEKCSLLRRIASFSPPALYREVAKALMGNGEFVSCTLNDKFGIPPDEALQMSAILRLARESPPPDCEACMGCAKLAAAPPPALEITDTSLTTD